MTYHWSVERHEADPKTCGHRPALCRARWPEGHDRVVEHECCLPAWEDGDHVCSCGATVGYMERDLVVAEHGRETVRRQRAANVAFMASLMNDDIPRADDDGRQLG